jgi:hypothetical protein
VPQEWFSILYLPLPVQGSQIDELLKLSIVQAIFAAWTCLLELPERDSLVCLSVIVKCTKWLLTVSKPLPELMMHPASSLDRLDPLSLSLTLPRTAVTPVLNFFSRRLLNISMRATHWLHITNIVLSAVSITATSKTLPADGETVQPKSPGYVWDTARKWYSAYMERDPQDIKRMREIGLGIAGLIEWIQSSLETRGEDGDSWFKGTEWQAFLNLLVDVAKKVSTVHHLELGWCASY